MLLKKNIWLIFYLLVLLGLGYMLVSIFSVWSSLKDSTRAELAYINRIFASSVSSTMDQREIMLELIGGQLLHNQFYRDQPAATQILDKLLDQDSSLVGFGLANFHGELIAASSNINLDLMPNLREYENSRETFLKAIDSKDMVLGTSYFLEALDNWVIPIRKSIRNANDQVSGIMTAGIQPNALLPRLDELGKKVNSKPFQVMLIHDQSFRYAYISGLLNSQLSGVINQPIAANIIQNHVNALRDELGLGFAELKRRLYSAEYMARSADGKNKIFSLQYLPKYQLWSLSFIPQSYLVAQLTSTMTHYISSFMLIFFTLFLLVRYIHRIETDKHHQLVDQAHHDFLTGLNNRLYLQSVEPDWVNEQSISFSVLFIDLDNFKNINDSYGHSYGDRILKQVAQRLNSINFGKSLICRQGGDEFIVLSRKTGQQFLDQLAQEIMSTLSQPFDVEQFQFTIGASIGICRYPEDGDSFDSLFSAADTAMYHAKAKKNNHFIFTEALRQKTKHKLYIEQALLPALKNGEFHMEYQPQMSYKGNLFGVEALVRWEHQSLGRIRPDEFIGIAEDCGAIIELGHFIIDQSIRDIAELENQKDYYNLQLSINISVRQLLENGFIELLTDALNRHKFPSRQLTLEITESLFIKDFEYVQPLLQKIRALGIKISLDDFGTGYSSLSMLRRLPIDELKIDKSFINHITSNARDRAMVINIMNIAQNLGLRVVAEGIEKQAQNALLQDYRCDLLQGFLHCRPVRYADLIEYIAMHANRLRSA